jgi:archaemetzincin
MQIGVLTVGETDSEIIAWIKENLTRVFPESTSTVVSEEIPLREEAFDEKRKQYKSSLILSEVQGFALRKPYLSKILGVVDTDIFVPKLNFVFGEATCPGKAALISLWRLKPEFYGNKRNTSLFLKRILKEAVHELGHTLGLEHCSQPLCVMHFSNSIFDTDKKQKYFCDKCYLHAKICIRKLGQKL